MSEVLSIRIRKDLREKMRRYSDIDWRKEIEEFIERRIREMEFEETIREVESLLRGVEPAGDEVLEVPEDALRERLNAGIRA